MLNSCISHHNLSRQYITARTSQVKVKVVHKKIKCLTNPPLKSSDTKSGSLRPTRFYKIWA